MKTLQNIKSEFPIFKNHPDLVYLDSAATALKPESVLLAMDGYYREYSSNVSRGLYPLAEKATEKVEEVRAKVGAFIDAPRNGVVFTGSATAGINMVATGLREKVTAKHNIVVTALEHHSNFLPWKELARVTKAELRIVPVEKDGALSPETVASYIDKNTFVLSFTAVSNVLGIINPVGEIVESVRKKNTSVLVLVDVCQAVGHINVSLKKWDADFLVFSAHKLFGPTGIGILAGKSESLNLLSPVNVGGGTVLDALSTPVLYKDIPERLEGGTPNIAGIVGLGAAIDFVSNLGITNIREHEIRLTQLLIATLQDTFMKKVSILGSADTEKRVGIVSFTITDMHPHDIAQLLGEKGICVRAGEHCARPLHQSFQTPASTRVSLSLYNSEEDMRNLIVGLKDAATILVS